MKSNKILISLLVLPLLFSCKITNTTKESKELFTKCLQNMTFFEDKDLYVTPYINQYLFIYKDNCYFLYDDYDSYKYDLVTGELSYNNEIKENCTISSESEFSNYIFTNYEKIDNYIALSDVFPLYEKCFLNANSFKISRSYYYSCNLSPDLISENKTVYDYITKKLNTNSLPSGNYKMEICMYETEEKFGLSSCIFYEDQCLISYGKSYELLVRDIYDL